MNSSNPSLDLGKSRISAREHDRRSRPASAPAATASEPYRLDVVQTRAGLDALEPAWNDLYVRASEPTQVFQSFAWSWHWCNHYLSASSRTELALITAHAGRRLVMVWPLVIERHAGFRVLRWMGSPVTQYGDVLVQQEDRGRLLRLGWEHALASFDVDLILLRKVRTDAAVAGLLGEEGATILCQEQAPYLDLASAGDFARYEERYSSKARKNRRRHLRRLAEDCGPIEHVVLGPGPAARDMAARAIAMKRAWIESRGLVSRAFACSRIGAFFADVADASSRDAGCRISVLKAGGQIASLEIGLLNKGRLAVHIIVYEMGLERYGPGALGIEHSLRTCMADGIGVYDLLAPNDSYKQDWADGAIAVRDLAFARSLAGRAYIRLYICGLRERLKAAVARIPAGARRPLVRLADMLVSRRR